MESSQNCDIAISTSRKVRVRPEPGVIEYGVLGFHPKKIRPFCGDCTSGVLIPTDDVVATLNIPLVTLHHIFFDSDWARDMWASIIQTFNESQVHGLRAFTRVWLGLKKCCFVPCLTIGMACCGLWEIWKARISLRYESKVRNWKRAWMQWAPRVAHLINQPYTEGMQTTLLLFHYGIHTPPTSRQ